MGEMTTIQIRKETRSELKDFGKKGETYDQVIHTLMDNSRKVAFFEDLDRIIEEEEFVSLDDL
jgi:hypothetical protein